MTGYRHHDSVAHVGTRTPSSYHSTLQTVTLFKEVVDSILCYPKASERSAILNTGGYY